MSQKTSSEESAGSKVPHAVQKVHEVPSPNQNYDLGGAFAAGASIELYEPVPEYEGRHRYDPTAEWTEKEERRLVRRVSFVVESSI